MTTILMSVFGKPTSYDIDNGERQYAAQCISKCTQDEIVQCGSHPLSS
ncbi:hypothetical protein [Limosilactobacillus sp.]